MSGPFRVVAKLRRRDPGTASRTTTITRTVHRETRPRDEAEAPLVVEEVLEEQKKEVPTVNTAFAATGGFVAGVLASLLAGILMLLLERWGFFDEVRRNERRKK